MAQAEPISSELESGIFRLILSGDLTVTQARDLHAAATRALLSGLPVTVDLSQVSYLDAAALQTLASLQRTVGSQGRMVSILGVGPQVVEDARTLGMESVLSPAAQPGPVGRR